MRTIRNLVILLSTYSVMLLAAPVVQPMDVTKRALSATVAPMDVLIYPITGDIDGDGMPNTTDAFPANPNEWLDTDNDSIGNNADSDDDNDGINDNDEIHFGFDPLNPSDATEDADGDGLSNLDEITAGSNPLGEMEISTMEIEVLQGKWVEVASIDQNRLKVTRDRNQSITIKKQYGDSLSQIISNLDGSRVKLYLNGTLELTAPLIEKMSFKLKQTGQIECFIEDAIIPKNILPVGTNIHIGIFETTIEIPLSYGNKVEFRSR